MLKPDAVHDLTGNPRSWNWGPSQKCIVMGRVSFSDFCLLALSPHLFNINFKHMYFSLDFHFMHISFFVKIHSFTLLWSNVIIGTLSSDGRETATASIKHSNVLLELWKRNFTKQHLTLTAAASITGTTLFDVLLGTANQVFSCSWMLRYNIRKR